MSRFAGVGLRARVALALVCMAVLAVGTATVLANIGLPSRVNEAAEARLERQATHLAAVAAMFYEADGRWTDEHVRAVTHLAKANDLRVEVRDADGTALAGSIAHNRFVARAAIVVDGGAVGSLAAAPAGTGLLTAEESHLRHSLDRLHLAAGGISIVAALALGFVFAQGLAGPLRRIRVGAERMAGGDLTARVEPVGGPELAAVAAALNQLAESLVREEQLRKQGVGDLAHELRTPVNGLLGRVEAAQDGVLDPAANLAAMHAEILRLTQLLDDLSRLADAERPGLLLEKKDLDLAAVAGAAVERWRPRFVDREVSLEPELAPAPVSGDEARLAQVVDNLLANALRYTRVGGHVVVQTGVEGEAAALSVSDDGVGIATDDLPHVFKRFWRSEKSRSRETGGAGIGLAIVSELVRAHDGRVDAESRLGAGSTFRIALPVRALRGAAKV